MKVLYSVLLGSVVCACGPSLEPGGVMTPEERLREQEEIAYEKEQASKKRGDDGDYQVEEEEAAKFDEKQATMELERASLSAQTCRDVVEVKDKKGVAAINIVFISDGSVREAQIAPPYDSGPIADCIKNAYEAVIVPPFREAEYAMAWELDFSGKKKEKDAETAKLEKKIFGGPEEEQCKDGKDADGKPCKAKDGKDKAKKTSKKK